MVTTTTRNALSKSEATGTYNSTRLGNNTNFDTIDAALAKCNFAGGAIDPDTDNDEGEGYAVGSMWHTNTAIWECTDASEGAAIWEQIWPALAADLDLSAYMLLDGSRALSSALQLAQIATPTAPAENYTKIYSKADGKLYRRAYGGAEVEIGPTPDLSTCLLADGSRALSSALIIDQITTPDAPASGKTKLYTKSDGKIYRRAYGGSETEVGPTPDLSTCLLADGSRAISSAFIMDQIATPDAPSSGKTKLYTKSDGKIYYRPYGGSETEVGGGAVGGGNADNLIQNGSFEQMDSAGVPIGWVKIGTPTLLQDTGEKDGYGGTKSVKITSGGSGNEGLQFTLKQLKPSTVYGVFARAKSTSGDTSKIWTTGASSNLEDTGTSTSFETLSGTFTTDATPTDVVFKIGSDNNTDIVWFDELIVIEGSTAPSKWIPAKAYFIIDFAPIDWDIYTAGLDTGVGAGRSIRRHLFDQTTEEFVLKDIKIPIGIKPDGAVVFEAIGFAAVAAASRYIKLKFYHIAKAAGEVWNVGYNSITSGDLSCSSTQDALDHFVWQSPVATLDWANLDDVGIKLSRVAPSGTNLAADWCLVNFRILIPMMW